MSQRAVVRFLRSPFDATVEALEPILEGPHPARRAAATCVGLVAAWYLYVPAHELLHAAGCALSGGTVTTLEVQTQYGGAWLARVFPFVEPGGEYAGRLSDFDTHGSDLVYLATDALPFALSIFVGVPLLRSAAARPRPLRVGAGVVVGLAPFYNLPGDYFEMGSIVATHFLDERWQALRSDDVVLLGSRLLEEPAALGLGVGDGPVAALVVLAGLTVGIVLAYATWYAGERFARLLQLSR